jgi:hypothetical protein
MKTGRVVRTSAVDAASEGGVPSQGQIRHEGVPMGLTVPAEHRVPDSPVLREGIGPPGFPAAAGA